MTSSHEMQASPSAKLLRNTGRKTGSVATHLLLGLLAIAALSSLPPSTAQAVTLEVTDLNAPSGLIWDGRVFVPAGGTFSIGSRLTEVAGVQTVGVGISYYGYDNALMSYNSVQTDPFGNALFGQVCLTGLGELGSMSSLVSAGAFPAFFGSTEGDERVRVFSGYVFAGSATLYNPANAAGINGVCGGGDADWRVTFNADAIGETTVIIGTGVDRGGIVVRNDGSTEQATNAEVRVYVPEPALATGLWIGLATLGLGFRAHRREKR